MKLTKNSFKQVIADSININVDDISMDSSLLNEINIDSVETVKLCADIEKKCGVFIDTENLNECDIIMEIYEYAVKEKIKNIISGLYLVEKDEILTDEELIDQGFLDSKNIFELITRIEKEFDVIVGEYIDLEDFSSVDKLAAYILNRDE